MQRAASIEVLIYVLVIAFLQARIFLHGWRFSEAASSHAQLPGLRQGWIGGLKVDLSDAQWRDFRAALPQLAAANAAFVLLSRWVRRWTCEAGSRALFYVAFAVLFLGVLHGWCLLHVVVLTAGHLLVIQRLAGAKHGLPVIWAVTFAMFLLVRAADGLPFTMVSPALSFLDRHRGMLRWHVHYNLLMLRMLSYACDLHWARRAAVTAAAPARQAKVPAPAATSSQTPGHGGLTPRDGDAKARVQQHLPLQAYSPAAYWAYILYPPLYVAGPIISFNSFASQLAAPPAIQAKQVLTYAARWVLALACLELLTHTLYFNTIAKYRLWGYMEAVGLRLEPLHYAEGTYWVLVFMWLKFTVIWRFFRLVALADGVDAPENMTRCVCNNYDVEGFWRSWHASYNQWLVRYMYIPLGGASWRALNVWAIFTFVALWHDLEWRLLGWAWIMALAMAPEMAAKAFARSDLARSVAHTALWRHGCALAAAFNILVLMTANMVGFVVGLDGVTPLVEKIVADPLFAAATLGTLFCAAQVMFALRAAQWQQQQQQQAGQRAGQRQVDVG